jgi:outer membrane protein OmpA-like peptidoglycan-associated protein
MIESLNMRTFVTCIVLLSTLFVSPANGQLLKRADKHFNDFSYQEAIELYEHAWKKDTANVHVVRQLAESYRKINYIEKAALWYEKLMGLEDVEAKYYLRYAKILEGLEQYEKAALYLKKYRSLHPDYSYNIDLKSIQKLKSDSVHYQVSALSVNSDASDFGAAFYKDHLVFSSAKSLPSLIKRKYAWNEQNYLRLYVSSINEDGDVKSAELLSKKLGTNYHDGPVCFNTEGTEMFLTRNYVSDSKKAKTEQEGVVSIKLYYSKLEKGSWTKPKLMSLNMNGYSTGHPAISADGSKLYFISDRPGGAGGTDIYYSERKGNRWSKPVNLGKQINTEENEMFPFVSKDGTLYFASNGHPGLGGLDIFSGDLKNAAQPINMGYPINTSKDDFGLIIKKGEGYFASNRLKGQSFDDLYRFSIVSRTLSGTVYDAQTNKILGNTRVELTDREGNIIGEAQTGEDGEFNFNLSDLKQYDLSSEKERYYKGEAKVNLEQVENRIEVVQDIYQSRDRSLELSGLVAFKDTRLPVSDMEVEIRNVNTGDSKEILTNSEGKFSCPLERDTEYMLEFHKEGIYAAPQKLLTYDIPDNQIKLEKLVEKVEVGKVFVLDNIFYDLDKADIRSDAASELDKLVVIMNDNPSLKIELSSHTDARGSDSYNMALSQRRAKSAVQYIISNGIAKDRIVAKGYGETKLINHCVNGVECSKAEHQANRRTEVKVLDI